MHVTEIVNNPMGRRAMIEYTPIILDNGTRGTALEILKEQVNKE